MSRSKFPVSGDIPKNEFKSDDYLRRSSKLSPSQLTVAKLQMLIYIKQAQIIGLLVHVMPGITRRANPLTITKLHANIFTLVNG